MPIKTILITGANGEIGHGLIEQLSEQGGMHIVAMDLVPLEDSVRLRCHRIVTGDILDSHVLETLSTEHNFHTRRTPANTGTSRECRRFIEPTRNCHHAIAFTRTRNQIYLSKFHSRLWPPRYSNETASRQSQRRPMAGAAYDVRHQQIVHGTARQVLCKFLSAIRCRTAQRVGRFPECSFSGTH